MTPFIGSLLGIGSTIIDRLIPDEAEATRRKADLELLIAQGEFKQLEGQLEINKQEARHRSVFVAGWRPFIGWQCGVGLGFAILVKIVLPAVLVTLSIFTELDMAQLALAIEQLQEIDVAFCLTLLGSLLGLGGLRTYEKIKGVTR